MGGWVSLSLSLSLLHDIGGNSKDFGACRYSVKHIEVFVEELSLWFPSCAL